MSLPELVGRDINSIVRMYVVPCMCCKEYTEIAEYDKYIFGMKCTKCVAYTIACVYCLGWYCTRCINSPSSYCSKQCAWLCRRKLMMDARRRMKDLSL